TRTWEEALTYCEGLALAGYSDWRLPNMKELASILDYTTYYPAIDTTYFPNTNLSYYWSATTYAGGTSSAWFLYLNTDYAFYHAKSSNDYVRCVR
ncbi:MAG: DUF1566 domain-containing protein, partial [Nitrospinota bacterium]